MKLYYITATTHPWPHNVPVPSFKQYWAKMIKVTLTNVREMMDQIGKWPIAVLSGKEKAARMTLNRIIAEILKHALAGKEQICKTWSGPEQRVLPHG